MKELHATLEIVQVVVFVGLGVIALWQWIKQRSEAAGWLAATFGILGGATFAGQLLPEDLTGQAELWATRALLAVVVLFPYYLYRFMTAFVDLPRAVDAGALGLTVLTILASALVSNFDVAAEPSAILVAFLALLAVQWVSLSLIVAAGLWRGGRDQPAVARRRMSVLALGAAGLAATLVVAELTSPLENSVRSEVAVDLLGIACAVLFLLGFAPPAIVRHLWRKPEARKLAEAELELMDAITPSEIAAVLLPRVSELLAARGAVLIDHARRVVGSHGLSDAEVEAAAGELSADRRLRLEVPLASGLLVVELGPFTPFFGRDETDMLRSLATLAALALARARLLDNERASREQLLAAQRLAKLGSWEWDLRTGAITRSDELLRIYGIAPEDLPATYPAMIERATPDDRDRIREALRRALEEGEPFDTEFKIDRIDGTRVVVHAQGRVVRDADGDPIKLVGTAQDITERKRQEEFRDRFIADAAHELRTPLTTVVGFIELLEKRWQTLSEERLQAIMEQLSLAGGRMSDLVNNLLDLSRLQQGQLRLKPENVAIARVAANIVKTLPPPDGTFVDVQVGNGAAAFVDPQSLEQVLSNLLTNAYRYGGPRVVVIAHEDDDAVLLSVTDDGPGVEESVLPHLFSPFARGPNASRAGGSGLGLAIIKGLVEASGGAIWHAAVTPTGARFNVRLPRRR
ncbi:MAG: PAS domain-containing sensor histidine kinase [Actinomycetota bacterium]